MSTPEYDDLLARGYPHLRRLISSHPDDTDAHEHALAAASDHTDLGLYHVDWPTEVAYRYVRGVANAGPKGLSFASYVAEGRLPAAAAGLANNSPIDENEGRALLIAMLDDTYSHFEFQISHAAFLIEAMIGTPAFVDAVLGEIERTEKAESGTSKLHLVYCVGFALRRLSNPARASAEARVRSLIARLPDDSLRDLLAYVVGERTSLDDGDSLGRLHFCNDPALILSAAATSCRSFDASLVAVAGDALLDCLHKRVHDIRPNRIPGVIEELSHLRSKKVEPILKVFLGKKKYAALAQAALDLHAGKATKPTAKKMKKMPAKKR